MKRRTLLAGATALLLARPRIARAVINDPVTYYALDGTAPATTAVDSSGSGNTLNFVGTPTWVAPGKVGSGAIQFDAAGDWLEFSGGVNLPQGATAAFTLAGWVKAASTINLCHLFGFGMRPIDATGSSQRGILVFNGHYYFWGGGADWDSGINFDADNVWHHIAFTASSTTITFYRDGTNRASAARPALAAALSFITLGRRHTSGTDFIGFLDDVRFYARELAPGDIGELVALGTSAAASPRKRRLPMY